MRKLYLHIMALCLMMAGAAKAQVVSPSFNYGFENDLNNSVPTDWTVIDANNDGVTWFVWTWGEGGSLGHLSDACVKSITYNPSSFTETYDPDDYLVSPQVTIGAYTTLSFYARAGSSLPEEHFSVEVSTTGNSSASNFTMVQEWTQTGDEDMDIDGWAEYTVDLSAYSGQAIYIAIHHSGESTYDDLRIDDVCLTTGAQITTYDISIGTTRVTSENLNGVTGLGITGTVTYNPNTAVLTLDNATVIGDIRFNMGYGIKVENPTINLVGNNEIGSIDLESEEAEETGLLTISGNGVLNATNLMLASSVNLLVKDCDVNFESTRRWCAYGYSDNILTFNNTNATFKSSYSDEEVTGIAIGDFAELNLVGCEIVLPENAVITTYDADHAFFVCESDGLTIATEVVIRRADGINNVETSTLSVSPNPASDFIRINGLEANEEVRVFNALGQEVKTARLNDGASLSVSDLASGVYMLRSEQSGLSVKFTVK